MKESNFFILCFVMAWISIKFETFVAMGFQKSQMGEETLRSNDKMWDVVAW